MFLEDQAMQFYALLTIREWKAKIPIITRCFIFVIRYSGIYYSNYPINISRGEIGESNQMTTETMEVVLRH